MRRRRAPGVPSMARRVVKSNGLVKMPAPLTFLPPAAILCRRVLKRPRKEHRAHGLQDRLEDLRRRTKACWAAASSGLPASTRRQKTARAAELLLTSGLSEMDRLGRPHGLTAWTSSECRARSSRVRRIHGRPVFVFARTHGVRRLASGVCAIW